MAQLFSRLRAELFGYPESLAPISTTTEIRGSLREDFVDNNNDPDDSGYSTLSPTPCSSHRSHRRPSEPPVPTKKRQPVQRRTKLKVCSREPASAVKNRFTDLKLLFDEGLHDHLSKHELFTGRVSMALHYLGESEAEARPFIVVSCDASVSRKVRQWFKSYPIRSYCHPTDNTSGLPIFEVYIEERLPPKLLSGPVYMQSTPSNLENSSVCGQLLRIYNPDIGSFATLGGLVKIHWNSKFAIFGMTVQHAFHSRNSVSVMENNPHERPAAISHDCGELDSEEETWGDESEDDLYEVELPADITRYNTIQEANGSANVIRWPTFSKKFGTSVASSMDIRATTAETPCEKVDLVAAQRFDWALIDIDNVADCWPNHIPAKFLSKNLKLGNSLGCSAGLGKRIWIMSGVSGIKIGSIASVPAFFTITKEGSLVEMYYAALADGSALQPGDSGSWAIDELTGEVYGQVIASDFLNHIYIVPFGNIIEEMKASLRAECVAFPSYHDLDQCGKQTRRQHPQCPVVFKNMEDAYGQFDIVDPVTIQSSLLSAASDQPANTASGKQENKSTPSDWYGNIGTNRGFKFVLTETLKRVFSPNQHALTKAPEDPGDIEHQVDTPCKSDQVQDCPESAAHVLTRLFHDEHYDSGYSSLFSTQSSKQSVRSVRRVINTGSIMTMLNAPKTNVSSESSEASDQVETPLTNTSRTSTASSCSPAVVSQPLPRTEQGGVFASVSRMFQRVMPPPNPSVATTITAIENNGSDKILEQAERTMSKAASVRVPRYRVRRRQRADSIDDDYTNQLQASIRRSRRPPPEDARRNYDGDND